MLVLTPEDKARAGQCFDTPLIFTVHEAKGLEYDHVILYNLISHEDKYDTIAKDVSPDFLTQSFDYRRAKDKTDKSLEIYKFYVNALYVAMTRAVKTIIWLESNPKHRLLQRLEVNEIKVMYCFGHKFLRHFEERIRSKVK